MTYSKNIYQIVNIVDGKYLLDDNKLYASNKIKKISNIVEYVPEPNNEDEILHNTTQQNNRLRKNLRLDGIDRNNILSTRRNENENWYWDEPGY